VVAVEAVTVVEAVHRWSVPPRLAHRWMVLSMSLTPTVPRQMLLSMPTAQSRFPSAGYRVVAQRLKDEYKVECAFENVSVATARWITCDDDKVLQKFREKVYENLAIDQAGELLYIAPTRVNLELAMERHPDIQFHATREI